MGTRLRRYGRRRRYRDREGQTRRGVSEETRHQVRPGQGSGARAASQTQTHGQAHLQDAGAGWLRAYRLPPIAQWRALFHGGERQPRYRRERRVRASGQV